MEEEKQEEVVKGECMQSEAQEEGFISFLFKADAKEYFKIWIVNITLTILTLGIYSAWAKVRTNRYFYANSYLNGTNFEYNAKPKRILYGRTIVVLFYALFLLFSDYLAMLSVAGFIVALFLALLPWLLRQAISFKLKNTSYRNIPFRFSAKTRSFYFLVIGGILLIIAIPAGLAILSKFAPGFAGFLSFFATIFIFVILLPSLYRRYKLLVINNTHYGETSFSFTASKRDVIWVFLKMFLLTVVITVAIGIITYISIESVNATFGSIDNFKAILAQNSVFHFLSLFTTLILYLFTSGLYKGVADAFLSNLSRNHTVIANGKFKGTIHPLQLGLISATNALLLLFSLGLLYPWTKIRYMRYKLTNTHFFCNNYDQFTSVGYEKSNPLGEETLDFFDIDIGF